VTHALLERGDAVTVFDSGVAAGFDSIDGTAAQIVRGDIRDARLVAETVARASAVVHLAAQTGIPESISNPQLDAAVNVQGSLNILEAVRIDGPRRLVFASSNSVVAGWDPPVHEGLVPRPMSPYGAGKAAIEAYLHAYHAAYGLQTVALRFSNVYGPWSAHKTSVVARFMRAYLDGGPLVINGSGAQTRDFLYATDVALGVLLALDAPAERVGGEVFHLATGVETSLLELAETLFEVGGRRVEIEHRPASTGDVARNVSDIGKARRALGYEPQLDLRIGLARTLAWFREHVETS
jgi:UDP-glucose 4-epimerase